MRAGDARGGTNSAGVPPEAFAMPDGMRMRYDVPCPELAELVTGYAVYASDARAPMVNWYLPAPAILSILVDAGPVAVAMRSRTFADIDRATLYGPTSRAFRTVTHGGIAVGIGLTALGWAMLTDISAAGLRDGLVPMARVTGAGAAADLADALAGLATDAGIAPLLDAMLRPLFARETRHADAIRKLTALTVAQDAPTVSDVARSLALHEPVTRRIASRVFGMPPKPLLSRARFVRAVSAWLCHGEQRAYAAISRDYFDASHFLRDAHSFLGTTPHRFARQDIPFLRASLRARAAVIGAPTHVLHAA